MTKLNTLLLLIIAFLTALIFLNGKNKSVHLLANKTQQECLKKLIFEYDYETISIDSPQVFKGLEIFKIYSGENLEEARVNYEACFLSMDSEITSGVKTLPSVYEHFRSLGAKNIGFFKPQDAEVIYIYSKQKN